MSNWQLLLIGWAVMAVVMALTWLLQRRFGDAGIVDVMWTVGVGALAVFFAVVSDGVVARRALVAGLTGLWSLRLCVYLIQRVRRLPEDGRYREMRERWGERTQLYLFIFFQVQAFWSVLFAFPMLIAVQNPAPELGWLDGLGVAIWLVSVGGESLADRQLARFRADPTNKGKVCRDGLWNWSRHPNYFFEWIHWWAYVAIGITGPYGWLTLFGPLTMLFFLLKITGVPPTEAHALKSRGEAYREYQRTTSVFFPWPPSRQKVSS